jgi:pyruvate,water dikinase
MRRLGALAERVAGELIPELEQVGRKLAKKRVEDLADGALSAAIRERQEAVEKWREIYLEDFIPFAHGVRQLGTYYNDAVQPDDPYEFVALLKGEQMLASRRNQSIRSLADQVRAHPELGLALSKLASEGWQNVDLSSLRGLPGGPSFAQEFAQLQNEYMDVAYDGERLSSHPDLLLQTILEMSKSSGPDSGHAGQETHSMPELEGRFFSAVGPERQQEAAEVLAIGRLSWRLRDDDNVLVGRLESQLLRAMEVAYERLCAAGRLKKACPEGGSERGGGRTDRRVQLGLAAAPILAEALLSSSVEVVTLPESPAGPPSGALDTAGEAPRQLVGQPAAPGLATGRVRSVRGAQDLGRFRAGEVLVCDAIQPTMTHLVPLACAVIERRGGMLIHGAIIARELGIPCVNGVANAVEQLEAGEIVTVDGYLGIVTVGEPDFDLEAARAG